MEKATPDHPTTKARKKRKHAAYEALDFLFSAAELLKGRDSEYGRAYKKGGGIMMHFFPNGLELKNEGDFSRFISFLQCVSKLNRYSESLTSGGHSDSAIDLINYAGILSEFTEHEDK
ncbi:MAG: hypothetical protein GY774_04790 [Planctomycetes bacterium]|nr:hypothetical protein [Planctomycetota bacterium]